MRRSGSRCRRRTRFRRELEPRCGANVPFGLNASTLPPAGGSSSPTARARFGHQCGLSGSLEGSFIGSSLQGAFLGYGFSTTRLPQRFEQQYSSRRGRLHRTRPEWRRAFRDGLSPTLTPASATPICEELCDGQPARRSDRQRRRRRSAFAARTCRLAGMPSMPRAPRRSRSRAPTRNRHGLGPLVGRRGDGRANGQVQNLNLANSSLHYIFSGAQSGPVALPLTGHRCVRRDRFDQPDRCLRACRHARIGHAERQLHQPHRRFDDQRRDQRADLEWLGGDVPIYRDQYFSAYSGGGIPGTPNPAQFNITCTPNCGAGARGSLDGFFAGRPDSVPA